MPLTRAAQRVQRSAYPNAYAKHEPEAARIVDAITGGAARTPAAAAVAGRCAKADEVTSSGWVRPVKAPVGSGFRTNARPNHQGVDLSTRRGVPIVAAAAGTVVHMECDNQTAPWYSCNRDGSPNTPGCGWYLDIRHAGGIITRYCHMLRRPLVDAGDKVAAGQQIGLLGTSGNSSGPHLHFEVHTRGDRSANGAINPVEFMRGKGAPLGTGKPEVST
jgi:murein DD-endopeptidase MepM/ murein hydrolase activator NlpD